jgi:hypothetical protein
VAAERAYEEGRARGEMPARPFPDDLNCDVDRPSRTPAKNGLRTSDILIGTAALLPAAVQIGRQVKKRVTPDDRAA